MRKVLLVVSVSLPNGVTLPPGPRRDYVALAQALQATILDRSMLERSIVARLLARLFGAPAAQAWLAFRQHRAFDAILTDGEHIGIPLALLLKLARARTVHVTIGHRLLAKKKRPFFRWLKVHTHLTRIVLHSTRQHELATSELGIPAEQLALVPYQADPDFWHPLPVSEERLICSAGLEYRDYPTLFRAVEGLDVRVVIGAASYWSRLPNSAARAVPPANVQIGAFDYPTLRDLYARAALVVIPLVEIDNQAGITTLLEAMAMGKAVVITQTEGQIDVVEDRRAAVHGANLLRSLAAREGVTLEPNGFYVPPGDAAALRRAIVYLLDHPELRAQLGAAGRRAVERLMTVEQYAQRLRALVEQACAAPAATEGQAARARARGAAYREEPAT